MRLDRSPHPFHHGSHRALLAQAATPVDPRPFDAIVVPTARPAVYSRHVVSLAQRAGCPLLVLCSGRARASDLAGYRPRSGFRLIGVDLPPGYTLPLLDFATSASEAALHERRTDTALKRNIGLLVARMAGWKRIIFLDDDIAVPDPDDLGRAAALLDDFDTVGLSLGGYPDNSVVCHAHRITSGNQDTFVGGGAMAVAPLKTSSFFPNIYNEDWFFLLDDPRMRPVAVTGQAIQRPYDPFANPSRAVSEEFGDVMAEGIFWLLDQHRRFRGANLAYWKSALTRRRLFIADVIRQVNDSHHLARDARVRMLDALIAARARTEQLDPESCVSYLRDWRTDMRRWRRALAELPAGLSPEKALLDLGLAAHSDATTDAPREVQAQRNRSSHRNGGSPAYVRSGSCCSAQVLPSGSLNVTNEPHG